MLQVVQSLWGPRWWFPPSPGLKYIHIYIYTIYMIAAMIYVSPMYIITFVVIYVDCFSLSNQATKNWCRTKGGYPCKRSKLPVAPFRLGAIDGALRMVVKVLGRTEEILPKRDTVISVQGGMRIMLHYVTLHHGCIIESHASHEPPASAGYSTCRKVAHAVITSVNCFEAVEGCPRVRSHSSFDTTVHKQKHENKSAKGRCPCQCQTSGSLQTGSKTSND